MFSSFVTPWTIVHQVPLSTGFPRQDYWSGLPFPFPGDLLNSGTEPRSPTLQADSLLAELPGKPDSLLRCGSNSLSIEQNPGHKEAPCRLKRVSVNWWPLWIPSVVRRDIAPFKQVRKASARWGSFGSDNVQGPRFIAPPLLWVIRSCWLLPVTYWHSPSTPREIKLWAPAAADLQQPLKGVQHGDQEQDTVCSGKNWQNKSSASYFQEKNYELKFLHLLISRKAPKSLMETSASRD